jgi:prepilin-type N-terminal cleavage/methylation domain-containing protein
MIKTSRGFTLIEMAIVLIIITILIGGLAVPLSAQIQARRIAETKKTLEEAREAIIGYAMTHNTGGATPRPYLPCPDTNAIPDGRENRTVTGACDQPDGWFPWVDLGTAPQDAWGNRLHYSVENREYSDSSKGMPNLTPPLYTPPYANLVFKQICRDSTCATLEAIYLPVVLFSHGPNGWGANNINGNTLAAPTSADELENTNADTNFVSRTPSKAGDASGEFDDLMVWISDGLLRSRVCPAGGCP